MSIEIILLAAALIIVIPLALYASSLIWQLHKHNKHAQKLEADRLAVAEKNTAEAEKSILILLLALQKQQMSSTEAAMRVSHFSRMLAWPEDDMLLYNAFHQLAQDTSHIPILEQWQALSSQEQLVFDQQRIELELMHQANIDSASQQLLVQLKQKTDINFKGE